ncbi:hypothetical protein SAMN04487906_2477 [Zhouia amylolytica]|uniref:Thioredoxin domain-containing protein n=1 Tax=Zhouia amylolytica TaxID=376730 RepID=A0A1I6UHE8_9FLAO|nr:thioredoxin-like domain-containing protein [Zhouia amylolytica]MCQ0112805.1 hypothetical protein [Zhouia amylolytica]SFT00875.1 hypothetical protein SAMN04487906_2477 [Zhouia amylolytica]
MNRFFLVLITITLISCQEEKRNTTTYFGGEIVNPKANYVVLYHNEEVVDSAVLDQDNRFLMRLDNLQEGLYNFKHYPEYQYVFIEKGDSILFRLNTLDFDGSLVFSGKGSIKNNFLIDMFLLDEDEKKLVYNYYRLEPLTFKHKMDSLQEMKLEQFESFAQNFDISERAKKIAKASIDYNHFVSFEHYPTMYRLNHGLKQAPEMPGDFYDYRSFIDYGNDDMVHYKPYMDFLVMHLNNLSYNNCKKFCSKDEIIERTLHYHTHKLHLIDSLVDGSELRDNLFRNAAYSYLLRDHNLKNNEQFIAAYNEVAKNKGHKAEINNVFQNIRNLQPGNKLPDILLTSISDDTVHITDVVENPKTSGTIFYFWSTNQKRHLIYINKRMLELQNKYPSYQFVGINFDDISPEQWLNTVKANGLNQLSQYKTVNQQETSKKLVIDHLNKVIITDNQGIITNAFANANYQNIENTISR